MMATYWITFLIGLFIGFCAVPIYIVFLYMLIRYRNLAQFNTAFYHLVFQCGLLDLWYVIHQYLFYNRFLINLIPEAFLLVSLPTATTMFYGYFYIRACQAVSVLGISLNRFTAIVMPLRHPLIWTRKLTWITIITQHVIAAMLLVPGLRAHCFIDYIPKVNESGFMYGKLLASCVPRIVGPSAILVCILSVILIILYIVMFFKVSQGNPQHGQSQSEQKTHNSMAVGGAIISGILVLNTCFLLVALFAHASAPVAVGVFRKILDMLFCVVNPFVLLCFGSKVRPYYWKCVKQIFCIKENNQNEGNQINHTPAAGQVGQNNNNNMVIVQDL